MEEDEEFMKEIENFGKELEDLQLFKGFDLSLTMNEPAKPLEKEMSDETTIIAELLNSEKEAEMREQVRLLEEEKKKKKKEQTSMEKKAEKMQEKPVQREETLGEKKETLSEESAVSGSEGRDHRKSVSNWNKAAKNEGTQGAARVKLGTKTRKEETKHSYDVPSNRLSMAVDVSKIEVTREVKSKSSKRERRRQIVSQNYSKHGGGEEINNKFEQLLVTNISNQNWSFFLIRNKFKKSNLGVPSNQAAGSNFSIFKSF